MTSESPDTALRPEATGEERVETDWTPALGLPCSIRFGLPILGFTIGELQGLEVGSVIDSGQPQGSPVRVELNGRPIGSAEIEPSDGKLGFRLRELD